MNLEANFTMDPRYWAQDVLRCDLCETPVPPMYCDFCHVKLCKACVGKHLSDLSKEHKVVPYKRRSSLINYPECGNHKNERCEKHCVTCELPVCSLCLSSNLHNYHVLLFPWEIFDHKQNSLQTDIKELESVIHPKYTEMKEEIKSRRERLEKHYKLLTKDVIEQGGYWHKEIDIIVNEQKREIEEMKKTHFDALQKEEDEITQIISKVNESIHDLKKLLESDDVSQAIAYKSRNSDLIRIPPRIGVSLPTFSPFKIDKRQISRLFGSLSALSITTEERDTMDTQAAGTSATVRKLLDESKLITTTDTGYRFPVNLHSIACLDEAKFWAGGNDKFIKLYNLHGNLLKAILTKSGKFPRNIAVTRSGDLVYTDSDTKTVNIVKNEQIQEVIKLHEWKPFNVCSTSSGNLLVTMESCDEKTSKVVRYSDFEEKQSIQFDVNKKPLFSTYHLKYICENKNRDICVSDFGGRVLVVVNHAGRVRFRFNGYPFNAKGSFQPLGIATDSMCQILVADYNSHSIHVLNEDGEFLGYINNCDLDCPWGLSVDTRDSLYVAEWHSGQVKKIKYLSDV